MQLFKYMSISITNLEYNEISKYSHNWATAS